MDKNKDSKTDRPQPKPQSTTQKVITPNGIKTIIGNERPTPTPDKGGTRTNGKK